MRSTGPGEKSFGVNSEGWQLCERASADGRRLVRLYDGQRAARLRGGLALEISLIRRLLQRGHSPHLIGPAEPWRRQSERGIAFPPRRLTPLCSQRGAPLPLEALLSVGVRVAEGLQSLHQRGLVVGYLAPHTLMVDPGSRAVVFADLSFASLDSEEPPSPWTARATLASLAPEQTGRVKGAVGPATDQYLLGMLLYELAVGGPVREAAAQSGWVHWHLAVKAAPVHTRAPQLPSALSPILSRLLSKPPDERFPDMGAVVEALKALGRGERQVPSPAPGGAARSFAVSKQLYGREETSAALDLALEETKRDGGTLLTLHGLPGSGKTAQVNDRLRHWRQEALIGRGKFSFGPGQAALQPFQEIFDQIADALLSAPEERLQQARAELLAAAGPWAGTLAELSPRLGMALRPPPPPAPPLLLQDLQRRRREAAAGVLAALARLRPPLVLFLDDLQWASAPAVALLEEIVSRAADSPLLLIGAYRDNEIDSGHPLVHTLDRVGGDPRRRQIPLAPLDFQPLQRWVSDSLGCTLEAATPLTRELLSQAAGNPLFTHQLLGELHSLGEITYSEAHAQWSWRGAPLPTHSPADVSALLENKLRRLSEAARETLLALALTNGRGEAPLLAEVFGLAPAALRGLMDEAIGQGLVTPWEGHFLLSHDKVQQALLERTSSADRAALCGRIGWCLHRHIEADSGRLLEIAALLACADPSTFSAEQREAFLRLTADAAQRGIESGAYEEAVELAEAGYALVRPQDDPSPAAALRLGLTLARALYLCARHDEALELVQRRLPPCETLSDQAACFSLEKDLAASGGASFAGTVARGLEILSHTGEAPARLDAEIFEQARALTARFAPTPPEDGRAPVPASEAQRAALKLYVDLWEASYYSGDRQIMGLCAAHLGRIAWETPAERLAPMAAVIFGLHLANQEAFDQAAAWGQWALSAVEARDDRELLPKVSNLYCNFVGYAVLPFRELAKRYALSAQVGRENGDHLFGLWAAFFSVWTQFAVEGSLDTVLASARRLRPFVEHTGDEKMIAAFALLQSFIACHQAGEEIPGHQAQIEAAQVIWARDQFLPGHSWLAALQGQLLAHLGRFAEAEATLSHPDLCLDAEIVMFPVVFLRFYRGFVSAVLAQSEAGDLAPRLSVAREDLSYLAEREASCPPSYRLPRALLEAEIHRASGDHAAVTAVFDDALSQLRGETVPWLSDLLLTRYADHLAALGARSATLPLLARAQLGRSRWRGRGQRAQPEADTSGPRGATPRDDVDLDGLITRRIREAIELDIAEAAFHQTLRVLCEYSGAQRAALVREEGGTLRLVGDSERLETTHLSVPIEEVKTLPASALRYVSRTAASLCLADARGEERWRDDPYLRRAQVRSMLCVPTRRAEKVSAILYLENRLSPGVFDHTRVELIQLVLGQLEASLERTRALTLAEAQLEARRAAEAARDESDRRLEIAQAFGRVGIWSWDRGAREVQVSPLLLEIYGLEGGAHALDQRVLSALVHPDDQASLRAAVQACVGGKPLAFQYRIVRPDGEIRTLWVEGDAIRDSEGQASQLLGALRDVTEAVERDEEEAALRRQLQQAQKMEAIGQLTGGVAHDFNNLLAVISSCASLLDEPVRGLEDPDAAEDLLEIRRAADRAATLIRQLLAFSRGEPNTPEAIVLAPAVEEPLRMLISTLPASVELIAHLEAPLSRVMADPVQINQIVMNCCINARDAMEGRGRIEVTLQEKNRSPVECESCGEALSGRWVEIAISDSGPGIAPEARAHLFEPFFTTKEIGKGTGMGLAMAHGIVHSHGGHILLDSVADEGSTFRFLFPALLESELSETLSAPLRSAPTPPLPGATVMLIDDQPAVIRATQRVLESLGVKAEGFLTPGAALQALRADPSRFQLVVCDLSMPGQSCVEIARAFAAIAPDLPFVVWSGNPGAMDLGLLGQLGVQVFLEKPVSLERWRELLPTLIRPPPTAAAPTPEISPRT